MASRQRVNDLSTDMRVDEGGFTVWARPQVNCAECGSAVHFQAFLVARHTEGCAPTFYDFKDSVEAERCECGTEVNLTWKSRRWVKRRVAELIQQHLDFLSRTDPIPLRDDLTMRSTERPSSK